MLYCDGMTLRTASKPVRKDLSVIAVTLGLYVLSEREHSGMKDMLLVFGFKLNPCKQIACRLTASELLLQVIAADIALHDSFPKSVQSVSR